MTKINLTELPANIKSAEEIIDYMLDNGYDTLVNDLGAGIEYSVDDVLESEEFLFKWLLIKYLKDVQDYLNSV